MRRRVWALFAALCVGACSQSPSATSAADPLPLVRAVAVAAGAEANRLEITGTVRLKRETILAFNSPGHVSAVLVHEGDKVRGGQILARLDTGALDAASASARAEAVRANADHQRLLELAEKGWVTRARVETARAAAASARARVAQAAFDRRLGIIVAPSEGVILRRHAEPGQTIAAGAPVLALGEYGAGFVLLLPMADADVTRLRMGQPAMVSVAALGAEPVQAAVSQIGARSEDGSGTFRVEVALPARPGLRSGLFGVASFQLADPQGAGDVTIPATAVFGARADQGFVYVVEPASQRIRRRQIALGPVGDSGLAVRAGLSAGESVVISGADRLRDGMAVRVHAP
jgi:RND family efflux transporter MFP subunit